MPARPNRPTGLPHRHDSTGSSILLSSAGGSQEREGSTIPFLHANAMDSPSSPHASPGVHYASRQQSTLTSPLTTPMPLGGVGGSSGSAFGSVLGSASGSGTGLLAHDYLTKGSRPSSKGSAHHVSGFKLLLSFNEVVYLLPLLPPLPPSISSTLHYTFPANIACSLAHPFRNPSDRRGYSVLNLAIYLCRESQC